MIATDGKPTIANKKTLPPWKDKPVREMRETIYDVCRRTTSSTEDWLRCVEAQS